MPATGESVESALAGLTARSGESAADIYGKWAGLSVGNDDGLFTLVRRKLVANGKSAQLRESLEETLRAGGATGESVLEILRNSGLVGWS